jgi:hypothetical protein
MDISMGKDLGERGLGAFKVLSQHSHVQTKENHEISLYRL